jgi:SAM-dependent methyltransferase
VRLARRGAELALVERRYVGTTSLRDAGPPSAAPRNAYAPSPWRMLTHVLPASQVGEHDVFIDLGCGRGRVLLEAAERYRCRRVLGVEVEPVLADAARDLLAANAPRLRSGSWEVTTADVLDYAIPDDLSIAYLFDPFTGPVFEAVIGKLEESLMRCPRRLRIVYLVPREIALLDGRLVGEHRGSAGWLRTGGCYEFVVGDLRGRVDT